MPYLDDDNTDKAIKWMTEFHSANRSKIAATATEFTHDPESDFVHIQTIVVFQDGKRSPIGTFRPLRNFRADPKGSMKQTMMNLRRKYINYPPTF